MRAVKGNKEYMIDESQQKGYQDTVSYTHLDVYKRQIPDGYIKAVLSYRYIHCFDIVETAAVVRLSMWECEQICKVHFNNVF